MRNNSSIKIGLTIGIIGIFIFSSLTPMAIGFDSRVSEDDRLECLLDNLRFVCTDAKGFDETRYEYYKEKILSQYLSDNSNDDIVIEPEKEESKILIEPPSSPVSAGPMDSPWPMKCHDVHHTGQSPYSTANTSNLEKWRFYFSDWLEDTPVIDNDGTIYCKGAYNILDHLYAIYPNGTEKWKYKTEGLILGSSPAIAEDGTIYVGSWDYWGNLYAINPDGTLKWTFPSGADIASSPAIADDGTIYFGNMEPRNRIYAVNPDGTEKWHYNIGWTCSDPAIGNDGTVYIGSNDYYLYAMNPNGTLKWRFKTGDIVKGPPSVAEDGTVYIGSYDGYLYALYPNNGTMKWRCYINDGTETNPSIGSDGVIYVGGNYLYAIYPNGTLKWKFNYPVGGFIHTSSPAVSADGTIYFGTDDTGYIVATNPDGTEKWRKNIANKWVESSPSIGEDGTVYIGSSVDMSKGYLHAFGSIESNSPPDVPRISGPTNGRAGEEYVYWIAADDPDNNPVRLYIEWGDGTSTGWTREYASGESYFYKHTWTEQGNYTIKVKAKDVMDEESDWKYLDITMPKNKVLYNPLLLRLLERFPTLNQLFYLLK